MCRIAKTNITDCHPWDLRTINLRFSFQRGKLLSGHRTRSRGHQCTASHWSAIAAQHGTDHEAGRHEAQPRHGKG